MSVKEKVYQEMLQELEARKRVLTTEKAELQKSAERIAAINEELAVIAEEIAAYKSE